jgi:hypothetical protein
VSEGPDGEKVRFNDKLDHLQARHPFRYNLATGGIIALVVVLLVGFHWLIGVLYAISWAGLRAYLWGDGRILRRQYDARVIRVAEERAAKRRRRA